MEWLSTFTFIFLAALPGRTTFVMVLLAARGHAVGIFCGAALAFAAQSLISVALGSLFMMIPQWIVELSAGLLFLFFAVQFWRHAGEAVKVKSPARSFAEATRSAFILVFMAEWGDVSQIAIASEAARKASFFIVFICALLALWLISALAVAAGTQLKVALPVRRIQQGASGIFLCIGIYLVTKSLYG